MLLEVGTKAPDFTLPDQNGEMHSLKDYKGGLMFVGVNYDEKDKTHECRIERFEKTGS